MNISGIFIIINITTPECAQHWTIVATGDGLGAFGLLFYLI